MPVVDIDLVRSFVGYLHLDELMGKSTPQFEGSSRVEYTENIVFSAYQTEVKLVDDVQQIGLVPTIAVSLPSAVSPVNKDLGSLGRVPEDLKGAIKQFNQKMELPPGKFVGSSNKLETELNSDPTINVTNEFLKVTLTYTEGEMQFEITHFSNESNLVDNDVLEIGDGPIDRPEIDIDLMIVEMIEVAGNEIPQSVFENFNDQPVDANVVQNGGEFEISELPIGRIVNGEKQDTDSGSASDIHGPGEAVTHLSAGLNLFEQNEDALNDLPSKMVTLGENTAANSAILVDGGKDIGGMIIRGDYHETNAIYQVNVLIDNDEIQLSGYGDVGDLITNDNRQYNDASFEQYTQPVTGSTVLGVVPGTTWTINYVEGDFYDVTTVYQANWLEDSDGAHVTATQSYSAASLGGNILADISELYDFGATAYDLIIIGGSYYELNAIHQNNILLESDFIQAVQKGLGGEKLDLATGDNEQINFAQILNIGGYENFQDWSHEVEGIVDDIQDGETQLELSFDFVADLPSNGGDDFSVLFVSGDYFDYNLIEQWNVAGDVDLAVVEDGDTATESAEELANEFDIQSGGNELVNEAVIVDIDSLSEFQILGGEYYEETMLVQANIIEDEDEVIIDGEFQDPVSLTLVDTQDNSGPGSHSSLDNSGPGNVGDDDVLPGVMS